MSSIRRYSDSRSPLSASSAGWAPSVFKSAALHFDQMLIY